MFQCFSGIHGSKRWLGWMLAMMAILMLACGATAEEMTKITGAEGRSDSVAVQPGIRYTTQLITNINGNDLPNWFRLECGDTATTFYLTVTNNGEGQFSTKTHVLIYAYDRNGEQISKTKINFGNTDAIPITLDAYSYATVSMGKDWGGKVEFTICTDSTHVAGKYSEILQAPTCAQPGVRSYPCELCGQPAYTTEEAPLGHVMGDWVTESASTCMKKGRMTLSCTVCSETLQERELDAVDHVAGSWIVARKPSCVTEGTQEQYCTLCSKLLDSQPIPARNHEGIRRVTAATCAMAGSERMACSICGEILSEKIIPPLSHTPGAWQETKPCACTEDGMEEQRCTECNQQVNAQPIDAHGHSPMEWQTVREASCQESGLREKKCAICHAVLESESTNALGHTYTEWEVVTQATKSHTGESARHCIHCGDTLTQIIPKVKKFLGIF